MAVKRNSRGSKRSSSRTVISSIPVSRILWWRRTEKPSKNLLAMTHLCPAGCYSKTKTGQVELTADGCLECGTCRVLCEESGEITWNYPRGGYGILFKFG